MTLAHVIGYPRIGAVRERTRAIEACWQVRFGPPALANMVVAARELRRRHG